MSLQAEDRLRLEVERLIEAAVDTATFHYDDALEFSFNLFQDNLQALANEIIDEVHKGGK